MRTWLKNYGAESVIVAGVLLIVCVVVIVVVREINSDNAIKQTCASVCRRDESDRTKFEDCYCMCMSTRTQSAYCVEQNSQRDTVVVPMPMPIPR